MEQRAGVAPVPRATEVRVHATNYDGTDHWQHEARLVMARDDIVVTGTDAGLRVSTENGIFVSPFNTNGHYWPDRWFNVIRLEEPGKGLVGFYCNIATPLEFDGGTVRYVDLQLDVRVYVSDGVWTYALVDEDEFEVARERYAYPDELVARCRAAVEEVTALVEARAFPFDA
jgi:protein associated with RNAse G/E